LDIVNRLEREFADWQLKKSIVGIEGVINQNGHDESSDKSPVIFFNASTRIHTLSINAAISLIASWSLRSTGTPVYYAVCDWGMQQCILGTNKDDPEKPPPCKHCVKHSQILFPQDRVVPIKSNVSLITEINRQLKAFSLAELERWIYEDVPLGELCLPGLRWALRAHHLDDDRPTRTILRRYLASAASLVHQFRTILDKIQPRALVVFNGLTFPEAVARHLANERGIDVITHEVGLRPYSAFFSHGEATFRELELEHDFQLNSDQEERLAGYLSKRFQGKYTMAGIQFWPEMTPLPEDLIERIQSFSQIVPVFTNVIFDTSQDHANTLFDDMFAWLDALGDVIRNHPETLFIIRAHPDEDRPGKESRESVANWVRDTGVDELANIAFISPADLVSSYELVRRSKFVLVYNSSIGLEASIMGAAVLCAGRARYTQMPTVDFPESREAYLLALEEYLGRKTIEVPGEFASNANRFLYYELYRASLDFSEFLKPYPRTKGMTLLQPFRLERLEKAETLKVVQAGIIEAGNFIHSEDVGS
jgi:hypothetical protein